ncbi:MAG: hypothetical protein BWY75_00029 [bacterium ADurb.Bin425]|nr:MAG: hypothetical protein BWY75_00029 [bacterium ADurb.Bin425]
MAHFYANRCHRSWWTIFAVSVWSESGKKGCLLPSAVVIISAPGRRFYHLLETSRNPEDEGRNLWKNLSQEERIYKQAHKQKCQEFIIASDGKYYPVMAGANLN